MTSCRERCREGRRESFSEARSLPCEFLSPKKTPAPVARVQTTSSLPFDVIRHYQLMAACGHNISGVQLAAATRFDLAINCDFAVLNQQLGVSASFSESREFQKLIEPNWFGFGRWIIVVQVLSSLRYHVLIRRLTRVHSIVINRRRPATGGTISSAFSMTRNEEFQK